MEQDKCPNCNCSLDAQKTTATWNNKEQSTIRFTCSNKCGYGKTSVEIEDPEIDKKS